ncbi:tumor protein p53-inducible protein 11-like isoform X5 [Lineus longissimus]|uniref:tumor protein p53-inducible protein 11-like isoform X5 n=1 Tax=Lineus longissimus TaxID=88925 RepID=UPI00315C66C5
MHREKDRSMPTMDKEDLMLRRSKFAESKNQHHSEFCFTSMNQLYRILFNRKHSSGDLHSRLKTRKLLGVGETDDGDVHRSKLSQILGHSENLYVKLPRGLRIWQVLVATMFSVVSLWALSFPSNLFNLTFETPEGGNAILPVRLYGAALLSLSIVFWSTVQSVDRDVIRWALMASIVYFVIQIVACSLSIVQSGISLAAIFTCLLTLGGLFMGSHFYCSLTGKDHQRPKGQLDALFEKWFKIPDYVQTK